MPQSWKCPECGLVNFASEANCKRCRAASPEVAAQSNPSSGIVLEDGYVLPPPPIAGIWRDDRTLVMDKNALLPEYCVKCNAPADGARVRKKLAWHHPLLYVLIFGALLFYVLLAMALSKRATIDFGLCKEHKQRRQTLMTIGFVLLAGGLIMLFIGFGFDYPGVGVFGILLFLFAVGWLVIASRVVTVKKIDDRYAWLTGVHKDFLARFPSVPSGI
jgi:uncharacterized integral membrane protein